MEDDISRARMDGIEMVKTFSRPLSQQQNPNQAGPIRKPGLDLIENDEVKTKRPSMWNIVLYNDDYTPIDFVELVLKTVFHISTHCCPVKPGAPARNGVILNGVLSI